jgi:hypothetical protein
MVQGYGQVIVGECHHIAAASFAPILFMQCGPHWPHRPATCRGAPDPGTVEPHLSAPSTTRRSADPGADAPAGGRPTNSEPLRLWRRGLLARVMVAICCN